MDGVIADASLAPAGGRKIDWAQTYMPVLNLVRERLVEDGSVRGRRIAVILPVEPKTAYLSAMLAEAGAEVSLAFQGVMVADDVAAGLAARGVAVFAKAASSCSCVVPRRASTSTPRAASPAATSSCTIEPGKATVTSAPASASAEAR